MKIQTKKIIAREFLILNVCVIVSLLTFVSIYPYNAYWKKKVDELKMEIREKKQLCDSLSKPYKDKEENQLSFTRKYNAIMNLSGQDALSNAKVWNKLYDIAKSDSIEYKWNNKWSVNLIEFNKELGFGTPQSFKSFILSSIITAEDIEKYNRAVDINSQVKSVHIKTQISVNKILSTKDQLRSAGLALIIAFMLLFFVRYMVYAIKWSITILKKS